MKTFIYQNKTYEIKYGAINHLIPHEIFHCGLSVQALGLVTYIFSLPKAWRFCIAHLSKQMKISPNSCRKYLGEIFSNPTCREVFKVQEIEASMFDLEEGIYSFKDEETQQGVELWSSMLAKDVSKPNRKKVLLIQTQQQRYLLNLCFKAWDSSSKILESQDDKKVDSSPIAKNLNNSAKDSNPKNNAPKNAQNLSTINKNLLQDSYKDSSSKRTREKSNNDLTSFLDLQSFNQNEQEAIRLWITYKQETSKSKLKPSQIDFQLRKITKLKEQGQDICEIIERSLNHSWQGLFPQRDSALRDKAGSLPFACAIDTQVLSPRKSPRNPAFSSQILESQEIKLKTKMPKNIGGKSVLRVENV